VAGVEDVLGAVDLEGRTAGEHLEVLVLVGMDVGDAREPSRREDPLGDEQLTARIRGRDLEDQRLPGHRVHDDVARVCHQPSRW
jgi:hypothetical protein